MKQVYRHSEAKQALPKTRKKRASAPLKKAAKAHTNGIEKPLYTAPIFNTGLAGKLKKYIRPFDPVWPSEEPES